MRQWFHYLSEVNKRTHWTAAIWEHLTAGPHPATQSRVIRIKLNGKDCELDGEMTIALLLKNFNIPCEGTAVAIDGSIIPSNLHDSHRVKDGDIVEVIRAIGGG